ncbi:MAG: hypothetical protein DMG57_30155 [Acidobacteria bacterium]|nr:MAG: hypothetical protein DMG57_30155 [Acidobacteriota bacterium]
MNERCYDTRQLICSFLTPKVSERNPIPILLSFQQRAGDRVPAARELAFEAVACRKGRILDQVHWGQSLRENSGSGVRNRVNQWEAMLECQASLTIAMGYRDLKPGVVGTCALPGTELEGRYERLLHDVRTNWTDALGQQVLRALKVLQQRIDALEADLSREILNSLPPSNRYERMTSVRTSSPTNCSSSSSPTRRMPARRTRGTGATEHSRSAAAGIFGGRTWDRQAPSTGRSRISLPKRMTGAWL